MSLPIRRPDAFVGEMCIDLTGRGRGVTQQLLHTAEVSAAVEEMRGGTVPQRMRSRRMCARGSSQRRPHRCVDAALIPAGTSSSEKDRSLGRAQQSGAPPLKIRDDGPVRRLPKGKDSLLPALPQHRDQTLFEIKVEEIQSGELAHPHPRGIEQFEGGRISQRQRIPFCGFRTQMVEEGPHGLSRLDSGKTTGGLGDPQPSRGICRDTPGSGEPCPKCPGDHRVPGNRRRGCSRSILLPQPVPQNIQTEIGDMTAF